MNWDAIGAIAELLGAIGVIASLVYLAVQIRQSTRATRGATYQDLVSVMQQGQGTIAHDAELSELYRVGMQDITQLNQAEAFRFNWLLGTRVLAFDKAMYQFESGMLAADRWWVLLGSLRWTFRSPGARAWWETFDKNTLSLEFVTLVEEILAEMDSGQPNRPRLQQTGRDTTLRHQGPLEASGSERPWIQESIEFAAQSVLVELLRGLPEGH